MSKVNKAFVHTVFFWLNEPNNPESIHQLEEGLNQLANISEIKQAFIGKPADTSRSVIDSSYSVSLTFVFDNLKDQEIYQDHTDHHLFIKECSHLWAKVLVYDAC